MNDEAPILEAIAALRALGVAAHPTVTLDVATFERFVRARAATAADIAALAGADLYLACACAEGNETAIAIFEARWLSLAPVFLARQRLPPDVVDEVKQRARERLFVGAGDGGPKIGEYGGRGSLEAWLRVLVVRVHANLRRQDKDHDDVDAIAQTAAAATSPEYQLLRARTTNLFESSLRDAFAELTDEERAIFRMQFAKGLTLDAMARVLGVHRATAARHIAAARKKLLSRVMVLLAERLGTSRAEVERSLGEWQSKLDISLSGLLGRSAT